MPEPPHEPAPGRSILLVDDDVELCALIGEYLSQHGYRVDAAHDGRSGLARAIGERRDLVILDVMLPVLDGFEVLRQLRRRSDVPVIMLTARTLEHDRIEGLEAGADDYLPKPFHAGELLARIRSVLRRAGRTPAGLDEGITVAGIRVRAATREAWLNEAPIHLTSVEFDILELLVRSAGRVISRDQVAAVLHQREASPYERSVDVHVSHLRRKLADAGRDRIRTIRGVGYLFSQE